jgi:hypothetical protein
MPNPYRKLAGVVALGVVSGGLGALTAPAQAAAHSYKATKTAHRRVPTPPDSYLQYKVYTVDQLIQQVSDNPAVRRRFARHFQMPEDRVVEYMRANLVESYIPKTGRYTVYCVHPSGKFYPVRQNFHRGTKVFALRNGEPVMKWVCGNPLTKFASNVTDIVHVPPKTRVDSTVAEFIPADIENEVVPSEGPATPTILVSPTIQSLASPVSSAVFRGAGPNLAYGLLPVAGLIAVNSGGHSNSGPPVAAVPEAGSLLYLFAGVPIVLVAIRRRKLSQDAV